jgi:hypothetical protein
MDCQLRIEIKEKAVGSERTDVLCPEPANPWPDSNRYQK